MIKVSPRCGGTSDMYGKVKIISCVHVFICFNMRREGIHEEIHEATTTVVSACYIHDIKQERMTENDAKMKKCTHNTRNKS